MLAVHHLSRPGLEPASFELGSGTCTALSGPSGAGKTLLLRALADLDPAEGEIRLEGKARGQMSGPQWRRRVGYLPAEPGWWSERLEEHFLDWPIVAAQLGRVNLTPTVAERPVSRLSTGERQRLALLRALERAPRVPLLDEPTGPLDEEATAAVEALIREKLDNGLAVLWVTHDRRQAARVATRHFRIEAGHLRPLTDDEIARQARR
ncbi:MAG TPA: ATP-binding cassette domain-containing protein [Kiloniellaceae bacterium]|nr:ATP-binding cassette domain-containing protein [Kiloniellaceae bacterium]